MKIKCTVSPAGLCGTECPHGWRFGSEFVTRVGSSMCSDHCRFFAGFASPGEVECNFDGGKS